MRYAIGTVAGVGAQGSPTVCSTMPFIVPGVPSDDPATITDKQLLSPTITLACDAGAVDVSFRNNFNFQDGFDGGVLEVSYDGGLTFQDVLAVGGMFVRGGYNGTINS